VVQPVLLSFGYGRFAHHLLLLDKGGASTIPPQSKRVPLTERLRFFEILDLLCGFTTDMILP